MLLASSIYFLSSTLKIKNQKVNKVKLVGLAYHKWKFVM